MNQWSIPMTVKPSLCVPQDLPDAVQAPDNALIVKNTFFDDCATEDACAMRRAYSDSAACLAK
eukprot:347895-Amphidinium_carterae.1